MAEETFKTIDELMEKRFPGLSYEELPLSPVTTYFIQSNNGPELAYECPECGIVLGMYEEGAPYAENSHSKKAGTRKLSELSKEELQKLTEKALDQLGKEALLGIRNYPDRTKTDFHCRICKEYLGSENDVEEGCC